MLNQSSHTVSFAGSTPWSVMRPRTPRHTTSNLRCFWSPEVKSGAACAPVRSHHEWETKIHVEVATCSSSSPRLAASSERGKYPSFSNVNQRITFMGNSHGKVGIVGFTTPVELVAGCVIFAASIVANEACSSSLAASGNASSAIAVLVEKPEPIA